MTDEELRAWAEGWMRGVSEAGPKVVGTAVLKLLAERDMLATEVKRVLPYLATHNAMGYRVAGVDRPPESVLQQATEMYNPGGDPKDYSKIGAMPPADPDAWAEHLRNIVVPDFTPPPSPDLPTYPSEGSERRAAFSKESRGDGSGS